MQNDATKEIPAFLKNMSLKEIGILVHSIFPDDDPGMNRARCDVLAEELGEELPEDWTALITDGKQTDADFPAWVNWFKIAGDLPGGKLHRVGACV